jgi:hypothetical protein
VAHRQDPDVQAWTSTVLPDRKNAVSGDSSHNLNHQISDRRPLLAEPLTAGSQLDAQTAGDRDQHNCPGIGYGSEVMPRLMIQRGRSFELWVIDGQAPFHALGISPRGDRGSPAREDVELRGRPASRVGLVGSRQVLEALTARDLRGILVTAQPFRDRAPSDRSFCFVPRVPASAP